MNYEIITVATHAFGTFNDLVNNKYNEKITVLGWGEKWTGFNMKYKLLLKYIENLSDTKIIIFLDGFDTLINNEPKLAIEKFKKKNYKVHFSKENTNSNFYSFKQYIFPNTCNNNN